MLATAKSIISTAGRIFTQVLVGSRGRSAAWETKWSTLVIEIYVKNQSNGSFARLLEGSAEAETS